HVRSSAERALPLRVEAELFRVAQEALANVRKHAHAKEVELSLQADPGRVRLSIRDDGRGFNRQPGGAEDGSYGLEGMKERARLLGGTLRVRSRPGRGTTVTISAPLPAEQAPG